MADSSFTESQLINRLIRCHHHPRLAELIIHMCDLCIYIFAAAPAFKGLFSLPLPPPLQSSLSPSQDETQINVWLNINLRWSCYHLPSFSLCHRWSNYSDLHACNREHKTSTFTNQGPFISWPAPRIPQSARGPGSTTVFNHRAFLLLVRQGQNHLFWSCWFCFKYQV